MIPTVASSQCYGLQVLARCLAGITALHLWTVSNNACAASSDQPPEVQRLFYLAPRELVVLRLQFQIDLQDLSVASKAAQLRFFQTLDQDHDGTLSFKESHRVPSHHQMTALGLTGRSRPSDDSRLDDFLRDGKVTPDHLATYLRTIGFLPCVFTAATIPGKESTVVGDRAFDGSSVFAMFDSDHDGRVSAAELRSAPVTLRKYDLDDDGTLSLDEIGEKQNIIYGFNADERSSRIDRLVVSPSTALLPQLARRIQNQYDRSGVQAGVREGKDGKLNALELGWTAERMRPHDIDGDGQLDFDELCRLLQSPTEPSVTHVYLGTKPLTSRVNTAISALTASGTGATLSDPHWFSWNMATVRMRLSVQYNPMSRDQSLRTLLHFVDADSNGYVDSHEAEGLIFFEHLFEYLDVDHDSKVFEKELLDAGLPWLDLAASQIGVSIYDFGNPLFGTLDTDDDHRLTSHELLTAASRLGALDQDGDCALSPAEIPRMIRIVVARASSNGSRTQYEPVARDVVPSGMTPDWFKFLDRNDDGHVSHNEFVGEVTQFQKLDLDRDGDIDPSEARPSIGAHK